MSESINGYVVLVRCGKCQHTQRHVLRHQALAGFTKRLALTMHERECPALPAGLTGIPA